MNLKPRSRVQILKPLFWVLALFIPSLLSVWAAEGITDPFIPTSKIMNGPYRGQLVEPSRRPIVVLSEEQAKAYGAGPGDIVIANLRHEGYNNFVIAKVPLNALADVIAQTSTSTIMGHTQLRFKFNQPIQIFQQPGNIAPSQSYLNDIIYSVDAAQPKGISQVVMEGMLDGHYPRVHHFMSQEEDFYYRVMSRKREVKQMKLVLDDATKRKLFTETLTRSQTDQYNHQIGLCFGNCTTEIFHMLDKLHPAKGTGRLLAMLPTIPLHQDMYLKWRQVVETGGDGKVVMLPTVNAEFETLKGDTGMRERFKGELFVKKMNDEVERVLAEAKNANLVIDLIHKDDLLVLVKSKFDESEKAEVVGRVIEVHTGVKAIGNATIIPWNWRIKSTLCGPLFKMAITKASAH